MIGVTLAEPAAAEVKRRCLEAGVLIVTVGDRILRLLPPLILTKEQADEGFEAVAQAIMA